MRRRPSCQMYDEIIHGPKALTKWSVTWGLGQPTVRPSTVYSHLHSSASTTDGTPQLFEAILSNRQAIPKLSLLLLASILLL